MVTAWDVSSVNTCQCLEVVMVKINVIFFFFV